MYMTRTTVSKTELKSEMNTRLHKAIGHKNISFGGTTLLAELDSDGSNWSTAIFMQGEKEDIDVYANTIKDIIHDVRSSYNLIDT
jgi:hypothetical protein